MGAPRGAPRPRARTSCPAREHDAPTDGRVARATGHDDRRRTEPPERPMIGRTARMRHPPQRARIRPCTTPPVRRPLEAWRPEPGARSTRGSSPSCQWALARDGEVIAGDTVGEVPGRRRSRYVIYSCTKAVVRPGLAAARPRGPCASTTEWRARPRVRHQRQGGHHRRAGPAPHRRLPPRRSTRAGWGSREDRLEAFARGGSTGSPAPGFEYHATSAHWVLAELLERIDGDRLPPVVARRVIEPARAPGPRPRRARRRGPGGHRPARNVGEPPTAAEWQEALGIDGFDVGEVTDEALVAVPRPEALPAACPEAAA